MKLYNCRVCGNPIDAESVCGTNESNPHCPYCKAELRIEDIDRKFLFYVGRFKSITALFYIGLIHKKEFKKAGLLC